MTDAARLALSIPDILEEIFSHFVPTRPWQDPFPPLEISDLSMQLASVDRGSLARCALVCKIWSPLALDLVWAALPDGIGPLFRLIPDYEPFGHGVRHISQIPEREWQRFQEYAVRVKCFVYKRRLCDFPLGGVSSVCGVLRQVQLDIASPVLRYLCERNDGQPLLPNLRIIQWTASPAPARQLALRILAGPRLTAFYIGGVDCGFDSPSYQGCAAAIESNLDMLKVACLGLEHVHITGTYVHEFNPKLDRLTASLVNLRSAKFDRVIGDAMVPVLARLPRLEVVDVELDNYRYFEALSTPDTFPALRELRARGNVRDVGRLVRSITSKRLSSIKLVVSLLSPRDVMNCVEPLPLLPCAAGCLARLSLDMCLESHGHDDDYLQFSVLLQSLLFIRQLEDVTLNLNGVEVPQSAFYPEEDAWMRRPSVYKSPPTRPSVLTIVDLATRRPMLEELTMEADWVSDRELKTIEELSQHMSLQTNIVLFDCHTHGDGRLAAALSRLFPNAKQPLLWSFSEKLRSYE
ncbi:hypothetical protein C8T65DRAFT_739916 [Cerioporus squamosus]|nr:hypothetical protein C8T65DRAFT_739916 [Cerioporus squamosus]